MRKVLKWTGIVLGALVGLIVIAVGVLMAIASIRMARHYDVQPEAVAIPTDAASIERGQHLASLTCVDCHGPDLGGAVFLSDPALGTVRGANLTPGKGGAGAVFQDADWVRAIRHGVDNKGRGLVAMPAMAFYYLSDADLGSLIAYVKTLPPVDKEQTTIALTPLARVLVGAGAFGPTIIAAETIPHSAARPAAPPVGQTAEYGGYLVAWLDCRSCHGAQLSGGKDPAPGAPPVPNLTPGGEVGFWKEADFVKVMRTGVTPGGRTLSPFMPWKTFSHMTDEELGAIWLYLASQPKLATTR